MSLVELYSCFHVLYFTDTINNGRSGHETKWIENANIFTKLCVIIFQWSGIVLWKTGKAKLDKSL